MEHHTASTSPGPFSGEDWFDPLEDAIRFRVRAFIEAVVAEEAQAALGGRERYQRRAARPRAIATARPRAIATATGSGSLSVPSER